MEHVEQALPPIPSATTLRSDLVRTFTRFGPGAVLAGTLILAAVLRFALLGRNSVWFDEAYAVRIALFPWQAIPDLLKTAEFHPPLHYFLMKAWIGVAGLGDASIRIPSACFSVLVVPLTYAVARRVSPVPVSLLSAFLVSLSPVAVMAGQDAKMYALLGALVLASTGALAESVERGGGVRWTAYVFATALAAYTHYLALLVFLAQGVWVAGFQRRHLRTWLGAAAAVGLLYAPWTVALWAQITRAPATGWGENVSWQDLSQLLGLYAFGGSLLGMPSFFFKNTSLPPIEQIIVLLPFILVAWRGIRAFMPGGRRLAFLGLPLVIPIGVTFVVSLVRPFFEARWFGFLFPFYAIILARGIVDLTEHVRGHRRWVGAGLTIGLLAYSMPVFARYYADPQFRPYRWREAAAAVQRYARPGDVFVYGDYQNELAFTYYFGPTPEEVFLLPHRDISAMRQLAARRSRMWLIVAPPFSEAMLAQTLDGLRGAYTVIGQSRSASRDGFPVIYLLQAPLPTER